MSKELLEIKDLHVNAGEKEILKGLNLKINKGEVHVIMGPNGAGKSTLANVILNNPEYTKTSGTVEFEGENINDLSTDKIAKKGIFMSFQLPEEIPGISTMNFLKYAKNIESFDLTEAYDDKELGRRLVYDGKIDVEDLIEYTDMRRLGKEYAEDKNMKHTSYGYLKQERDLIDYIEQDNEEEFE